MTDATQAIIGIVPPVLATGLVLGTFKLMENLSYSENKSSIKDMELKKLF